MEYEELIKHRKTLSISPEALLAMYRDWDAVQKMEFENIEGALVHEVFYDPIYRTFRFTLLREDWPAIVSGVMSPEIPQNSHVVVRRRSI
jgi:hypothetical protein